MRKAMPFFLAFLLVCAGMFPVPASAFVLTDMQDNLADSYGIDLFGFVEARGGRRLQNDPYERQTSIAEARLQLDLTKDAGWGIMKLKGDVVGDQVMEEVEGELRELNLLFYPLHNADVKIGRQVLTWGTGDLLFINDLFPKDWESFFIGRDDEYLKAPSDAVKASFFFDFFNMDLVYVPEFDGSVYVDGSRLSYWDGTQLAGRNHIMNDVERDSFFHDSEYALRLTKTISGREFAIYAYNGFWKTPEGLDLSSGRLRYPRMSAYGGSMRATLLGGIGNIEFGYYDSREDRSGTDFFVRNSEIRFLAGFEREIIRDLTGSIQYYLEAMQDYDEYVASLFPGTPKKDEYRHLWTIRLTRLMMNQTLRLSLFLYYSPSDNDGYLRPKAHYKISDEWAVEAGGNLFFGKNDHTFWGQFDRNTNAYAALRWSF